MRPARQRCAALTAVIAVLGTVALLGTASSAAAGGDSIRSAREQVAAMQAKVAKVAAGLQRGTREYEQGEAHLKQVQRQEAVVRRKAGELAAASADELTRLNEIAAAAYRHPLPSTLTLVMAGRTDDFTGALVSKADLEHVSGSQQDTLRSVIAARVRTDALARTAEQLSAEARETERRLARRLERLRATVDEANAELQAAAARLERAEAAERSRLARLARQRAAARASRARAVRASAGSCLGASTAGYANGFIPESALCPLWQAPGERLRADAAAGFNRMSQAHAASGGGPLCVTDSYRSYGGQVAVYRSKPSLAAVPGTSEHGWGLAVDLCGGVESYGPAYRWLKANSRAFGFFHPAWAEPSGSRPEPWHWEFRG